MVHQRQGFLSTTSLAHNGDELVITLASHLAARAWFILGLWQNAEFG